jgi:hypothetical protein
MKKIILILIVMLNIHNLHSSETKNLLRFDTIAQLDTSLKKDIIFNSVEYWLTTKYNNSSKVIDLKNNTSGVIVFEGLIPYKVEKFKYMCYEGNLLFNCSIHIKDGKMKISMDNMRHERESKSTCIYFKGFGQLYSSYPTGVKYEMGTTENGNIVNYGNCINELKSLFNNLTLSLLSFLENNINNEW